MNEKILNERCGGLGVRLRGFTLIELLVVIAIIALLVGILLPALAAARSTARKSLCMSNMKQFSVAYANYSNDFHDRIASFTWGPDVQYVSDIGSQPDWPAAGAAQAVDIFRRRADRDDIGVIRNWIPHVKYTHLVLLDYMALRLPEPIAICPEDSARQAWAKEPRNATNLPIKDQANDKLRWPYSSSYNAVPASFSPDVSIGGRTTVVQAGNHWSYFVGDVPLGDRVITDVSFPSQKVAMFDEIQRHVGEDTFYAYPDAKIPLLFFDSSVSIRQTADSNLGFNPGTPAPGVTTKLSYDPDMSYEPPIPEGWETTPVDGYYQWTRAGLAGIDFNGGEVPSDVSF